MSVLGDVQGPAGRRAEETPAEALAEKRRKVGASGQSSCVSSGLSVNPGCPLRHLSPATRTPPPLEEEGLPRREAQQRRIGMEIFVLLSVHCSCAMISFLFLGLATKCAGSVGAAVCAGAAGRRHDGGTDPQPVEGSRVQDWTREQAPGRNPGQRKWRARSWCKRGRFQCDALVSIGRVVLCPVPENYTIYCVRSRVRSGALVARMPLPGVAMWLWKGTRHGFCLVDLTSFVVISFACTFILVRKTPR